MRFYYFEVNRREAHSPGNASYIDYDIQLGRWYVVFNHRRIPDTFKTRKLARERIRSMKKGNCDEDSSAESQR